jgi:nickel transport protein
VAVFCAVLVSYPVFPAPAQAHQLNVFAVVQGKAIAGEAYFRGGTPVPNAAVTVLDAAGLTLGQTTTDAQGKFRFEPQWRCDHRLVLRAEGGHMAEFTVAAEELPRSLPAREGPEGKTRTGKQPGPPDNPTRADKQPVPPDAAAVADLLERLEAVDRQVAELRKELARYEDKVRWHDVLGGIGCIFGFAGLSFYFLGVRRREKLARGQAETGQRIQGLPPGR